MPRRTREGGFPMIPRSMMAVRVLVTVSVLAVAALARALPIQLTDSGASGAPTNATYTKADTVTNYYVVFTLFGGTSTFTTQFKVDVPLTPAFVGFNGLLISSLN